MKYNEPIRPAGIGRKQLAFPTAQRITELTEIESAFNDISSDSTEAQIETRISNAIALAKGSALAAASDAHKKSQNYPFSMVGITDFALSGTAAITTKTQISFKTVNVKNSNFHYDPRQRMIYVNEAGWYFVQCFFFSSALQGNHDYALSIETNVGGGAFAEVYTNFMDFRSTNKHPNLNGCTIINLPNQDERLNQAGKYGFRINVHGTMGFAYFVENNTQCTLNVFKLANIFEADRLFTIQA